MSNVAFLNTFYTPDRDEYLKNSFLQAEINNFHLKLKRECSCKYEELVRKQRMINLLRSKIKIVKAYKGET